MKIQKFKISNFNSSIIFLVILVFGLLFFYSIPNIHNKHDLQKHLSKEIDKIYPFDISLSPDITYSILPKPHFKVKNSKIFLKSENGNLELGEAKETNIYISKIGSFDLNKIKVEKINFLDSDLRLDEENFKFLKDIINLSIKKNLQFSKTRLYFKENKKLDTVINLILLDQINLKYDKDDNSNILNAKGKLYNQDAIFYWRKNLSTKNVDINLKIKPLNLNIENKILNQGNGKTITQIKLNRADLIAESNYDVEKKLLKFKSVKSSINHFDFDYDANIYLKPFYFDSKIKFEKLNLKNFFKRPILLEQIIKNFIYENENLNGDINLQINKIEGNKIFKDIDLKVNLKNKSVSVDKSKINLNSKIGSLTLDRSEFNVINNELIMRTQVRAEINNQKNFFKLFLIPKNKRKELKNINFYFEFNLTSNEKFVSDPIFNDSDNIEVFDKSKNIENWIDLKNYVNILFSS